MRELRGRKFKRFSCRGRRGLRQATQRRRYVPPSPQPRAAFRAIRAQASSDRAVSLQIFRYCELLKTVFARSEGSASIRRECVAAALGCHGSLGTVSVVAMTGSGPMRHCPIRVRDATVSLVPLFGTSFRLHNSDALGFAASYRGWGRRLNPGGRWVMCPAAFSIRAPRHRRVDS